LKTEALAKVLAKAGGLALSAFGWRGIVPEMLVNTALQTVPEFKKRSDT
jgi:hypothetical protein